MGTTDVWTKFTIRFVRGQRTRDSSNTSSEKFKVQRYFCLTNTLWQKMRLYNLDLSRAAVYTFFRSDTCKRTDVITTAEMAEQFSLWLRTAYISLVHLTEVDEHSTEVAQGVWDHPIQSSLPSKNISKEGKMRNWLCHGSRSSLPGNEQQPSGSSSQLNSKISLGLNRSSRPCALILANRRLEPLSSTLNQRVLKIRWISSEHHQPRSGLSKSTGSKCAQWNGNHHSLDYKWQIIQEYKNQLKKDVEEVVQRSGVSMEWKEQD